MSTADKVIRRGELFSNRMGHSESAECDGLLVRFGAEVRLIPVDRLAGALNELGTHRVKERRKDSDG